MGKKRGLEQLMPEVIARYQRGESCVTIGRALGFGGQSIHKRLVKARVARRTWKNPFIGHVANVEQRYLSGETPGQIAADFGCSKDAVKALLGRRGVALRSPAEAQRLSIYPKLGRQRSDERKRLEAAGVAAFYACEGRSIVETASAFEASQELVANILRVAGVIRTPYETALLTARGGIIRRSGKLARERDRIIRLYVEDKLSLTQIGAELGVTASGVRYILVRERIALRGLSESISASWSIERKEAERQRMLGRVSPTKGLTWSLPYKSKPWTVGEKNPGWKGGITPVNALLRSSPAAVRWRKAILARDNYTCVFCGARSGSRKRVTLHADHIKRWSDYPALRFELSNGRTLCAPCHKDTPTYGRYDRAEIGVRPVKRIYIKRYAQLKLFS